MKKQKINFIIGILLVVALFICISAEKVTLKDLEDHPIQNLESCYLHLTVNETKLDNNQKFFELLNQETLYGFYDFLVRDYYPEMNYDYKIRVYSSNNLFEYGSYSSLKIFYDNFNESGNETSLGGIYVNNNGILDLVFRYSSKISKITIENNRSEIDLKINSSEIKCERTCKIEGETGIWFEEQCCKEFFGVETEKNNEFICVTCGDGFCSRYETWYSCFEDCGYSKENFAGEEIPFMNPDSKLNEKYQLPGSSINPTNSLTTPSSSGGGGGEFISKIFATPENVSKVSSIGSFFVDSSNLNEEEKTIINEKRSEGIWYLVIGGIVILITLIGLLVYFKFFRKR